MFSKILSLPELTFSATKITEDLYEKYDLVIFIMDAFNTKQLSNMPYGKIIAKRLALNDIASDQITFSTTFPNTLGTNIILCQDSKNTDNFSYATSLRKALQKQPLKNANIALINLKTSQWYFRLVLRVIYAASLKMPSFKTKERQSYDPIKSITCYTDEIDVFDIKVASQGNAIARYLSILPKNYLTPKIYINLLSSFASEQGWGFDFYSKKKLESLKAQAFLAVARASKNAGIVHLHYSPESKNSKLDKIALVGKGVCYDTGGINVKPDQYMFGMQEDMQGSSVALGTFYMLTQMKVPYEVDCWLAITENNVDADSFTPNEVVTAMNGLTIETVHTDAEGRMILADTLALASKSKPKILIDYATLTGSSINALGKKYSSVFTNHFEWNSLLINIGAQVGERVWPFPMTMDFEDNLKSEIADTKQCCLESSGPDHIEAAKFLQKFIDQSICWLHMDLSAAMDNKGGLGAIPTASTGFGVWFTQQFLSEVQK